MKKSRKKHGLEKTKGAFGYPMDRGFPWIFDFHGWLFWGGVRLRQKFPWMIKIHENSLFAWIFSRSCFFVDFFIATRYAILHITHNINAACQHHPLRKKTLGRRSSKECSSRLLHGLQETSHPTARKLRQGLAYYAEMDEILTGKVATGKYSLSASSSA